MKTAIVGAVTIADPFHEGERSMQERAGERDAAVRNGGLIADVIPHRAIPFLVAQQMLVVGSIDEAGGPLASVVFGAAGMMSSPDGRSVIIDRTRIETNRDDALWNNVRIGADVGLLAIELASRRRLRINGVVRDLDDRRIGLTVHQAYPNCPKYIQRREMRDGRARPLEVRQGMDGSSLDASRSELVGQADTFFVASRHPTRGVDVSHRGGEPGFVRVLDPTRLRVPDYRGNGMFNTLGNFTVDDRASLVFMDFARGSLLQMTGTVALQFDEPEDPRQPTGGSARYWDFRVVRWRELPVMTNMTWERLDSSPYNPRPVE